MDAKYQCRISAQECTVDDVLYWDCFQWQLACQSRNACQKPNKAECFTEDIISADFAEASDRLQIQHAEAEYIGTTMSVLAAC